MPTKVILNPNADLGRGREYLDVIAKAGGPPGEFDVVVTEQRGHATELAAQAIADGYDLIVAAGGDGTVNEVLNSLIDENGAKARLGVIPLGTGNDFAHAMGITGDVSAAVHNLTHGRSRVIDLALMEDDHGRRRYFDNNLGVGFDANVVIRTGEITFVHGFLKYLLGVLTTLARDFRPVQVQMRFDEEAVDMEALFVYLGVGPRGGGGFLLTPFASHEDGLVDSCCVTMLGRFRALTLINSATKGTHIHTPYVTIRHNKRIEIQSPEGMPIHIDGEIYATPQDNVKHLVVTSLPAALEVVY